MKKLNSWINSFFFQMKSPLDLSINRILFFSLILYNFDILIQDTWKTAPAYFWNPVSIYALLNITSPLLIYTQYAFCYLKSLVYSLQLDC